MRLAATVMMILLAIAVNAQTKIRIGGPAGSGGVTIDTTPIHQQLVNLNGVVAANSSTIANTYQIISVTDTTAAVALATGTQKKEFILANGKRYRYDGVSGAIAPVGGIAQSLFYTPVNGKNLFDVYAISLDSALQASGGALVALGGYNVSDWIPVTASTAYTMSAPNFQRAISFYNSSKTLLSNVAPSTFPSTFTTPAGTAYLRFTCKHISETTQPATVQLEAGSSATTYQDYRQPLTIIASGTSITFGYNVGQNNWVNFFGNIMTNALKKGVTMVNGGVTGQMTNGMLSALPALLSGNPTAKIVILEGAINDVRYSGGSVQPINTENNLIKMVNLVRTAGMQPVLWTAIGANTDSSSIVNDQNKINLLNQIVRKVARDYNVPLADVNLAWGQNWNLINQIDGMWVHPTVNGQYYLASIISSAILK